VAVAGREDDRDQDREVDEVDENQLIEWASNRLLRRRAAQGYRPLPALTPFKIPGYRRLPAVAVWLVLPRGWWFLGWVQRPGRPAGEDIGGRGSVVPR